jgi:hypothetical protein
MKVLEEQTKALEAQVAAKKRVGSVNQPSGIACMSSFRPCVFCHSVICVRAAMNHNRTLILTNDELKCTGVSETPRDTCVKSLIFRPSSP